MTRKEAKELSLEMWRYLAEHPEIDDKGDLPDGVFERIKYFSTQCAQCPLCGLFHPETNYAYECPGCPPDAKNDNGAGLLCFTWFVASSEEIRQKTAREMAAVIENWNPEEGEND